MKPLVVFSLTLAAMVLTTRTHAGGTALTTERIAVGLASPTFITHAPGDAERLFVLERGGWIRIIHNGQLLPTPFLDITPLVFVSLEGGMVGLAFHPDYESNGFFYVDYTSVLGGGFATHIVRYSVTADPNVADPDSALQILRVLHSGTMHNAGWLGFGPDGNFYVPMGDGGGAAGAALAQDLTDQLHGKLLRIDVNGDDFPADPARNYAIPKDNPYVGIEGDDEIWARGLRNPFRASFDRDTGDLWICDVGAGSREEVSFQPASSTGGENYGWGCMEGFLCFGSACTCMAADLTPPVHDYSHAIGCAITSGVVYRGCAIPDLAGVFFFGDYCADRIWSFRYVDGAVTEFQERTGELVPLAGQGAVNSPVAFGEDFYGEILVVDYGGEIFKIVPAIDPPDIDGDGVPNSCEPSPADLNGDAIVDGLDLGILLANWSIPPGSPGCGGGRRGKPCPADINGDGTVDGLDLGILLASWSL